MKPANQAMQAWALLKPGGVKLHGVTQAINFILMPAIGYGMGLLFFVEQPMRSGHLGEQ